MRVRASRFPEGSLLNVMFCITHACTSPGRAVVHFRSSHLRCPLAEKGSFPKVTLDTPYMYTRRFASDCVYAPVTGRVPWGASWVRIVSGRRKTVANRVSRVGNH